MNPEAVLQILKPLALPIVWSLVITLVAWRKRGGSAAGAAPLWAGALVFSGAMLLGVCVDLRPAVLISWAEPKAVPAQVALVAGVLALLVWRFRLSQFWLAVPLGLLFFALASRYPGLADRRLVIAACWAVGALIALLAAQRVARQEGAVPILQLLVVAGLAAPLVFTVSLAAGKSASWLAGSLGVIFACALVLPGRGISLSGPGVVVLVVTLGTVLFFGVYASDLPAWEAGMIGASLVSAALAQLSPFSRLGGWKGVALRLALTAGPALVAMAFAVPRALREAGDAI